eukprot:COSAG01_NODE_27508_length_684_cov_0.940171_1_plen_93_part_00
MPNLYSKTRQRSFSSKGLPAYTTPSDSARSYTAHKQVSPLRPRVPAARALPLARGADPRRRARSYHTARLLPHSVKHKNGAPPVLLRLALRR